LSAWLVPARAKVEPRRLSENVHLLRYPRFFVTAAYRKYASFLRISDALHLDIFQQPPDNRILERGRPLFFGVELPR
jgi:hypothetical protein